jgi:NADPH:quinone reductase-like Zn-dependent oxidoreductase
MKGILVASPGAEWKVVEDLPLSEPADDQILVKSVYTAVNPV